MSEHDEQFIFEMGYNKGFKDGIKGSIPKAEVKKFLEEGAKNIGNNVLAIVREDYIHKADYESRLKADMVAMLTEIQLEIEESENCGKAFHLGLQMASNIIQQKINVLKAEMVKQASSVTPQEPILDKIRAEIRANSIYVMPQYGRTIREADVLHIIDKYAAEIEPQKTII